MAAQQEQCRRQSGNGVFGITRYAYSDTATESNECFQSATELAIPEISNEAMTCQELLAFSGAISAALPTGQLALESLFNSLTKGVQERNDSSQRWLEPDTCSCCEESHGGDCPLCLSPEWSLVMDSRWIFLATKLDGKKLPGSTRLFYIDLTIELINSNRFSAKRWNRY